MKLDEHTYSLISAAITPLDTNELRLSYLKGDIPRADKVKDLNKRYRWDLFWIVWHVRRDVRDAIEGYDDSHLDTALRRIVPDVTL